MRVVTPSEQPDLPCTWFNSSFNSGHTWARDWVEREGGDVHGCEKWISTEGKRDDLKLRWQLGPEGLTACCSMANTGRRQEWYRASSPDSQHSFISFNYFKLGFRKQLRQGGKTMCLCISIQWNANWTLRYIFRCFVKGWQAFKGTAALGDNVLELKQPSFQMTVSWLQLWIQGKNSEFPHTSCF